MIHRLNESNALKALRRMFGRRTVGLLLIVFLCTLPGQTVKAQGFQRNALSETVENSDINKTFDDVFLDQEFRRLQRIVNPVKNSEKGWLERFIDWLFDGGNKQKTTRAGNTDWSFLEVIGTFLYWLAWALAITATAYVGWILLKAILKHFEDGSKFGDQGQLPTEEEVLALDHPPGELPSDEYERRAVELSGSGNYKAAVRELVLGSMSWIERGGLIRYRRGLTNRDYVRAIWRKPVERESLEHIVGVFERAYFGRRPPDKVAFDVCRDHYQRAFLSENVLVET